MGRAQQASGRAARPVERVRGTHDRLPDELAAASGLLTRLHELAATHGYRALDTPVLEHTDLFLRKSGGERVAQLYAFNHRGRDITLRPEFTAPAVRAWIAHLQGDPLPARLAYSGPVFRYEKPQAGRARQFTEFGCEMIGATGTLADAEVIALAIDGLRLAGITRPRVVLGHIGIVIAYLGGLGIDQRTQDWLTWSMERLRRGDDQAHELPLHLRRLEAELDAEPAPDIDDDLSPDVVAAILRQAGVELQGGARSPEEIVAGLFAKRRRRYDATVLHDAAAFVSKLTQLTGPPRDVLAPLRALVRQHGLDSGPLDELDDIVNLLGALSVDPADVTIDLGMGRGLHYYTGMLFEVYAHDGGPQLCGGGRYDDLAQVLGARQSVAACGFSFGVERVIEAGGWRLDDVPRPMVLVIAGDDPVATLRLAQDLRDQGWVAAIDHRGRNETATRRVAERMGYVALARSTASGLALTDLHDGTVSEWPGAPQPGEVRA